MFEFPQENIISWNYSKTNVLSSWFVHCYYHSSNCLLMKNMLKNMWDKNSNFYNLHLHIPGNLPYRLLCDDH